MHPHRSLGRTVSAVNLPQPVRGAVACGALVCAMLAGLGAPGCGRAPGAGTPILSRPAINAIGPRRLAFTARGRVWVAEEAEAAEAEAATARLSAVRVPGETHQDRPVWLPDGECLGMSSWFDGQADLAIWAGGALHRLTATPAGELLDDVAEDGRFLFERDGLLLEMPVAREAAGAGGPGEQSSWRTGPERFLTRGRDGRYTPDGRHILFVRGLEREPLGIWRQDYAGGDDSEVFLLDLVTLAVTCITNNPSNDELPVPLDDAGRRFIVCHETAGPYRPWLVQLMTPRLHRIRRFPSPDGDWPALFPVVRRGEQPLEIELWYEADGRLFRTKGAVRDSGLAFTPAVEVHVVLSGAPARSVKSVRSDFGKTLFRDASHWLGDNSFTAERWRAIPARVRRRFAGEMGRAMSREAAEEILARLLGRFRLLGLYYLSAADLPEASPDRSPHAGRPLFDTALAKDLSDSGMVYVSVPRLVPAVAAALDTLDLTAASAIVLDLRQTWGGWTADSLLVRLCGASLDQARRRQLPAGRPPPQPVIALISGKTYGEPEILAEGLRALGCGRLVGRPTAGAAVATELHMLESGGALVMPLGPVERPGGGLFDGHGVAPDLAVPELPNPDVEPWFEAVLAVRKRRPAPR